MSTTQVLIIFVIQAYTNLFCEELANSQLTLAEDYELRIGLQNWMASRCQAGCKKLLLLQHLQNTVNLALDSFDASAKCIHNSIRYQMGDFLKQTISKPETCE